MSEIQVCPECKEWFEPTRTHTQHTYCTPKCQKDAAYKRKLAKAAKRLEGMTFEDLKREKMRGDL